MQCCNSYRQYCQELSRDELDLVIKSNLISHRHTGPVTLSKKHKITERNRPRQQFFFQGIRICRYTFCFLYNIDKEKLTNIAKSLDTDGLKPRIHGLTGKQPRNSLTFADREHVHTFLIKYASDNALPLPGRLPNHHHENVLLLPSDKCQADIHLIYEESARAAGLRSISSSTFVRIWRDLCPNIVLAKPKTDLCLKCQQFSSKIGQSGHLDENEKHPLLTNYDTHIQSAKGERDFYRKQCLDAKNVYADNLPVEGALPCSLQNTIHYSWDYAQQVHYPHHSQQVGPIIFKTPRKCEVFGVCCEGTGKQTFYLADEGESPGKGANSVVSFVHHYLHHYGLGEEEACFHFDNCVGQNKNNTVLWYAMWRVIIGLHKRICFGLMVAGHTKFEPDWHFGLWKATWRHCDVETLDEVANTVLLPSRSGHNVPQLVKDKEKPVQFYDWKECLEDFFKPLKNITKYQHFRVNSEETGVVYCKHHVGGAEERFSLLKKPDHLPAARLGKQPRCITGAGLTIERQWYLHDEIGQFFRSDASRIKTCPEPSEPKPCSSSGLVVQSKKKKKFCTVDDC